MDGAEAGWTRSSGGSGEGGSKTLQASQNEHQRRSSARREGEGEKGRAGAIKPGAAGERAQRGRGSARRQSRLMQRTRVQGWGRHLLRTAPRQWMHMRRRCRLASSCPHAAAHQHRVRTYTDEAAPETTGSLRGPRLRCLQLPSLAAAVVAWIRSHRPGRCCSHHSTTRPMTRRCSNPPVMASSSDDSCNASHATWAARIGILGQGRCEYARYACRHRWLTRVVARYGSKVRPVPAVSGQAHGRYPRYPRCSSSAVQILPPCLPCLDSHHATTGQGELRTTTKTLLRHPTQSPPLNILDARSLPLTTSASNTITHTSRLCV